jgi:hypothetical protein
MYSEKFTGFPQIADNEIKAVLAANPDASQGAIFNSFVGHVAAEQVKSKDTVSGKVSDFLKQVCPIAIIALGVVSFAADVSSFFSTVNVV